GWLDFVIAQTRANQWQSGGHCVNDLGFWVVNEVAPPGLIISFSPQVDDPVTPHHLFDLLFGKTAISTEVISGIAVVDQHICSPRPHYSWSKFRDVFQRKLKIMRFILYGLVQMGEHSPRTKTTQDQADAARKRS